MKHQDVRVGRATVPRHEHGGWALPGRTRTLHKLEAMAAAAELDAMISALEATQPARPVRVPVEVVRRRVDYAPTVHSRV